LLMLRIVAAAASLAFAVSSQRAIAADGVIEINHACATTGCFSGDGPGYPVTISTEGSYRLTSDLVVPAGTNGIEIVPDNVSIDLNQFAIRGPLLCCSTATTGTGILFAPAGRRVTVRNGKIRGFGLDGINLRTQARIEGITLTDIMRDAISVDSGSYVEEALISFVGRHGILFRGGQSPSLYRDNVVWNVAQVSGSNGQSIAGGRASGPNVCTDQLCGTSGSKFFYLTTSTHLGDRATTACAPGFHMASIYEIFDPSELEYDTTRGKVHADSGQGPPAGEIDESDPSTGWIRGGLFNSGGTLPPASNCFTWTSSEASVSGTVVLLNPAFGGALIVEPWHFGTDSCNTPNPVWCVQD
jgi:hypothetical protein